MLLKSVRLFILLAVMLNHAVMACDALVVHIPEHEHTYTSYIYDAHTATPQHASNADSNADEHHSAHAHVTCAISYIHSVNLTAVGATRSLAPQSTLFAVSYSPPVPPPNV
ncbi:cobalt transporter [Rheinheimera sp. YQF-2]|uniref:Cobalt transporter n=1 Tax=Rheinheimera lutimaris TaxID=2740584 RepID=A0A7Y5EJJ1_9GAMM|nr:cobalt transporter [Rheinheimera lutimaris]NRQ43847.1 cobalt transporter [Rheinheimera lutimaris]